MIYFSVGECRGFDGRESYGGDWVVGGESDGSEEEVCGEKKVF